MSLEFSTPGKVRFAKGRKSEYDGSGMMLRNLRALPRPKVSTGGVPGTMYADNEILFPHYAIPALRDTRGPRWRALIDSLSVKSETSIEVIALMSVMIQLNGCLECETDSYRAMRGCTACALQTLRRFKGSDDELIEMYEASIAAFRETEIAFES